MFELRDLRRRLHVRYHAHRCSHQIAEASQAREFDGAREPQIRKTNHKARMARMAQYQNLNRNIVRYSPQALKKRIPHQ